MAPGTPRKGPGRAGGVTKKNMGKYVGLTNEHFCKHGTSVNHRKNTENHKGQP